MKFETGQTRSWCKTPGCGVVQELKPEGYWAYGETRNVFTPILVKPNHYQKYMCWRNANPKRRK